MGACPNSTQRVNTRNDGKVPALLTEGPDEAGRPGQSFVVNVRLICSENRPTRDLRNRGEQDQRGPGFFQCLHEAPVSGFKQPHLLISICKGGLGPIADDDGRGPGLRQLTL